MSERSAAAGLGANAEAATSFRCDRLFIEACGVTEGVAFQSSRWTRTDLSALSDDSLVRPIVDTLRDLERLERDVLNQIVASRENFASALARTTTSGFGGPAGELLSDDDLVRRSPLMSSDWYAQRHYEEVAGQDSVTHYLTLGWRLGYRPSGAFDGSAYLKANPDIAAAGVNPLVHYLRYGAVEGRKCQLGPITFSGTGPKAGSGVSISVDLRSYDEYVEFARERPEAFADATEKEIRDHVLRRGVHTAFFGRVPAEESAVGDGDLRERLISRGLNARTRAVADEVVRSLNHRGISAADARVYAHEGITHLAELMRRAYPRFIGSEYAPTAAEQRLIYPVPHNNVCASSFPDASFDVIFSCDVLEHVYDRDAMLREAARTLAPGGVFLATFPFDHSARKGWLCAELIEGRLVHHLEEPIFHGNPMDAAGGSLVFEIPGWDIVERAKRAGFRDAVMRFICDQDRGVTASVENRRMSPRGVFILTGHV